MPLTPKRQAVLSQAAVSKALVIIGMFMPKLGLTPFLGTAGLAGALTAGAAAVVITLWATSAARSHDPISWERATEKNRNT
jgi:heme A synthase